MSAGFLKSLYTAIIALFPLSSWGQADSSKTVSLLFMGDIMGHDSQIASARDSINGIYNYDNVFRYISPVISGADIAIANLEVTLAGTPYTGYPQFSSPSALAAACKNAGIDFLVTANNHSADRGRNGIVRTINNLDSIGMPHTGTFLSRIARDTLSPLMFSKNGISMALLNYTYGTNGIRVPRPVIVDSLDKYLIIRDIQKAKMKKADLVILFLHWGTEYDTVPSASQEMLAGQLFSAGADLIIGSHPHVLQKMEMLNSSETGRKGLVVYSLGNFISNQRKPKTDGGSMVKINLIKTGNGTEILDAGYYLTWVYTPFENRARKFYILPCTGFEKRPEFFSNENDFVQMTKFIYDSRALLNSQNKGIVELQSEPDNQITDN